jgi:hypothetical protein
MNFAGYSWRQTLPKTPRISSLALRAFERRTSPAKNVLHSCQQINQLIEQLVTKLQYQKQYYKPNYAHALHECGNLENKSNLKNFKTSCRLFTVINIAAII